MMDWLLQLDREILHLVNTRWANSLFDLIMPFARYKNNWIPLYIIMIIGLVWRYKKNSWLPILVCVIAVAISDQLASSIFKPIFQRMRPCQNTMLQVRTLIECGSGFSFVSSHAANHFALAITFAAFFKSQRHWLLPLLIFWASWISYAQVYVGYHYPSDVVVGGMIGSVVALLLLLAARNKFEKLQTD